MTKRPTGEELEQMSRSTIASVVKDLRSSKHPAAPGAVKMGERLIRESQNSKAK
jgi:predicted DNA-binding transcriptional regulator AlpA